MGDAPQLVHIPLVHGERDDIDAKLMPAGYLYDAKNIRWRKDARMSSRYGYDFISGSAGVAVAAGNIGPKHSVYFKERTSASSPAQWFDRREDGVYSAAASASCVGTMGVPRRFAVARNLKYSALSCDMVQAGSYIFAAYQDADYSSGTINGVSVLIYEAQSMRLISRASIGGASSRNVKITTVGTTVCVVWADAADTIKLLTYNSSSLSSTLVGTVVTVAAGRAFAFDIAPNDSSTFLLAYEASAGGTVNWGTVTTAGVLTGVIAQATANPARPSVCKGSLGNVVLVWAEGATFATGNLYYRVDTTAGAAVVAKTALDSGGFVHGFPVVGPNATDDYSFGWHYQQGGSVFTKGKAGTKDIGLIIPVSKPFIGPNNACLMWCVNFVSSSNAAQFATYKLIDVESPHSVGVPNVTVEAIACGHAAMPGSFQTLGVGSPTMADPRRFCVPVTTVSTRPGASAVACLLPTLLGSGYGADIVRIDSGPYEDRLLSCQINGQLLFSGPRVREFDGSTLHESGLADGPEYVSLSSGGAPTIPAGTYQYTIVYEWYDRLGRRHRSPPCTPVSITLGGAAQITVTYSRPAFSDKLGGVGSQPGISVRIYRTKAAGTVFYLVNDTENIQVVAYGSSLPSYTDVTLDATLGTHEILYTQGARGGQSGLLPNDEPPPCRFIWAGNSRVILGGLEDPTAVQWSKLVFPGEPVQYSIDNAFRANVDDEVTAVAEQDGVWYVFTRNSIWQIAGDGPDDTGAGSFSEPRRLTGDVGCVAARSLVKTPQGIMFQGRTDRMYLLPQGGGAPVPMLPMRESLSFYSLIAAAVNVPDENVVAFLCLLSDASDSVLIIYDTRLGEWSYDLSATFTSTARKTLDVYDGKLVIDGVVSETSSYTDDKDGSSNAVITQTVTTGHVRPFGPMGYGRCRRVVFLGEARMTGLVLLQVQVSYDGGASFSDVSPAWSLSTTVGAQVRREWLLKYPRGEQFVFKVVAQPANAGTTGEGIAFNSLTLECFPSAGTPRMSASERS